MILSFFIFLLYKCISGELHLHLVAWREVYTHGLKKERDSGSSSSLTRARLDQLVYTDGRIFFYYFSSFPHPCSFYIFILYFFLFFLLLPCRRVFSEGGSVRRRRQSSLFLGRASGHIPSCVTEPCRQYTRPL
jgi:hypothetical protein